MAEKSDLIGYLGGLESLMSSQDKAAIPRSSFLVREYQETWDKMKNILKQEHEDADKRRAGQGNEASNVGEGDGAGVSEPPRDPQLLHDGTDEAGRQSSGGPTGGSGGGADAGAHTRALADSIKSDRDAGPGTDG